MQHKTGKRPFQLPIRLRLTIWTTLSLSLILLLFTTFLYVRVRRSLLDQVDAGLSLAANQALLNVDNENGRLAFQSTNQNPATLHNLSDDFVIYLLAQDGTPLDVLTSDDEIPAFSQPPTGFSTQFDQGEAWRVYRQTLNSERPAGWVQVAQELDPVNSTLASLLGQMAWGVPLALLVAGLGGAFLASRALRPIHRITQTAQAINAGDLAQRIHYLGPDDEVGQLAQTFDTMLDRLEAAFLRERRFTGDAAHELRTPLAALKGQIGVSLSKPRSPTAYQETLQGLEEQVDRLIRLSNDLLFMARLDQGQFQPRMESIALDSFLAAIVDQIRPLA